jgi:hypothetical protein
MPVLPDYRLYLTLAALFCCPITAAKTVSNASQIEPAITHSSGKQHYQEQMEGVIANRSFGQLPVRLDHRDFVRWLAPEEKMSRLTLTGAKPWGKRGLYIGVACFALDDASAEENRKEDSPYCQPSYLDGQFVTSKFYIGVFRWQNELFTPVARSAEPLNSAAAVLAWQSSLDESDEDAITTLSAAYNKLDLAPYKVSDDSMAFGVRSGASIGYSGGGRYQEYLQLLMIKGENIVTLFYLPIYQYADLAGEWNPDGTRQHDISESISTVHLLKTTNDGFYDLNIRIKSDDTRNETYRWSAAKERYVLAKTR